MSAAVRWTVSALAAAAFVLTPSGMAVAAPAAPAVAPPHVVSYVPLRGAVTNHGKDTVFGNVDYNGGPVMPSNRDYMVLWSPSGLTPYGTEYVNGIEQYFTDLAHDSGGNQNVDSIAAQYNDLTGAFARYAVTFGGAILDTDPYPASQCPAVSPVTNCLTDAQIQHEIEAVVAAHHLKTDLSHEYFLVTPPHVESCFNSTAGANPPYGGCSAGQPAPLAVYCAYHGQTTVSPMLLYSNDPYVTGNSGCDDGNHPNGPSDGALEGGMSHEHNESISDPIPNDAWTQGAGSNQGMEIGDLCEGQLGTPLGTSNGASYNQVINGHFYWYQEEWSNQGHSCLQRLTAATTRPAAHFTVTAGSGLTLNFNASRSTAPGGVADYVWQFNDANGAKTVETTSPATSHTFPSAGAYAIGLTIYASNGLSAGGGGIVSTGHSGLTPGFTTSPSGLTVTFSGLTTISTKPVTTYLWEFGDGTTGTGATPSHTYKASGSYKVTAVLFSGVGSAYPGSGAAPVTRQTVTVT